MKYCAIVCGVVLILIGMAGYFIPASATASSAASGAESTSESVESSPTKSRSITAMIPAFVGLPIVICGLLAVAKPTMTKHMMHVAAGVSLLGALAATGRGIPSLLKLASGAEGANGRATLFLCLMAVVCWVYVIMSIQSFLAARRKRLEPGA